MRKLLLLIALPILLLAFAPVASAQDDERPEFKMSCREALKLGLDKFMDVYGKRTQDYSTFGQKQAFGYWVDCKRPANDALAAKILSEEKRKQVESVREEFNKFGTALWGLTYLEAGGGTMWGLISVGSYAARENFMETLIRTLALPERRSARARRSVGASLAKVRHWLASGDRKPFTEGSEPEDVAQRQQSYRETIKETKDSLSKLRDILDAMPDDAAERLAKEMASEAKDAISNSPLDAKD